MRSNFPFHLGLSGQNRTVVKTYKQREIFPRVFIYWQNHFKPVSFVQKTCFFKEYINRPPVNFIFRADSSSPLDHTSMFCFHGNFEGAHNFFETNVIRFGFLFEQTKTLLDLETEIFHFLSLSSCYDEQSWVICFRCSSCSLLHIRKCKKVKIVHKRTTE